MCYLKFKTFIIGLSFILGSFSLVSQVEIIDSCTQCSEGLDLFNQTVNSSNFSVSHGSPTFGTHHAWIWSHQRIDQSPNLPIVGEGVFSDFQFDPACDYCIEIECELSAGPGGTVPSPTATFKVKAATGLSDSPALAGGEVFPTPTTEQDILVDHYSNYQLNQRYIFKIPFSPSQNYDQIWFHPHTEGLPQVNFALFRLEIHKVEALADFEFKCPRDVVYENHFYYPNDVDEPIDYFSEVQIEITELCLLDELLIDGSSSGCVNGDHYIQLDEIDFSNETQLPLYSSWENGHPPNNIKITDLLPQGYQLRPGKIYRFTLGVESPYDEIEKFFKIVCCDSPCLDPADAISYEDSFSSGVGISQGDAPVIAPIIFPNPATDHITLQFLDEHLEQTIQVRIFDFQQELMYMSAISEIDHVVWIGDWEPGFYACQIRIGEEVYYDTIVKE